MGRKIINSWARCVRAISVLFLCTVLLCVVFSAALAHAQPERISTDDPLDRSVDEDGRAYWLTQGIFEGGAQPRLRRYWGGSATTIEASAPNARGLEARAPFLFLWRAGSLQRRADCGTLNLQVNPAGRIGSGPPGYVYWVEGNRVLQSRIDGSSMPMDVTAAAWAAGRAPGIRIGTIAVDTTHIYWIEHTRPGVSLIWRTRTDGSTPQIVSSSGSRVDYFAVDEANVFFATSAIPTSKFGRVYAIDKTDFHRRDLISPIADAATYGLCIGSSSLYWSVRLSAFRYGLIRAPLSSSGGSITVLEQRVSLLHLQATRTAAYWSDSTGTHRLPDSLVTADFEIQGVEITQGFSCWPTMCRSYPTGRRWYAFTLS